MASYILGTVEITDPEPLAAYGEQVGPIIERFGGRIQLIGPVTVLEGDTHPDMAAIIEFNDPGAATTWYHSADYAAIRGLRQASGRTSVVLVAPSDDQLPPTRTTSGHPNVQLARQGYQAFADSDLDALLDLLADNIVWHVGGDGPLSGDHTGKTAVTDLLMKVFELTGGSQRLDLLDLFADDHHIVARIHETATRAADGATLNVREAHVMQMNRDGKVTHFRDLPDDPATHDAFFT